MNIILAPHRYLPNIGGVEILVNKLAEAFIKKSYKISIVTSKFPFNLKSHEIIDEVVIDRLCFPYLVLRKTNFIRIFYLIFLVPFIVLKLWKLMKKKRPHIINVYYVGLNAYYILFLSYLYKFRLVVTLQGFSDRVLPFLTKKRSWIFNRILKKADYVTSCSQSLLDDAQKHVPEIKNKSKVIPNGFDPEDFKIQDSYQSLRPYIFSLGRFSESRQKGFDILIMAFRAVINKGYDVDLIIAGSGPEREGYETLVNLLQLGERVKFFGKADRSEVVRLFNGCEFFVLPSRIESFGIVNLEAMAAGKAIVAANVNGVPELVKDGINGILVKAKDDKALAEGMTELLGNSELRDKLGTNGRRMVKGYNWDDIADRYLEIYQKVLDTDKRDGNRRFKL